MINNALSATSEQQRSLQAGEIDVSQPLIDCSSQNLNEGQRNPDNQIDVAQSRSQPVPSNFIDMQKRSHEQAKQIQLKIKDEFLFYLPLLCLDLFIAFSGVVQLINVSAFLVPMGLISDVLAGIYARLRLNTVLQLYAFNVYMITTILNMLFFLWSLFPIKTYNGTYEASQINSMHSLGLAATSILHLVITINTRQIKNLLQERDILLAGLRPHDNDQNLESDQVYAQDPLDLQKNLKDRVKGIEKTLQGASSCLNLVFLVISVILTFIFLLNFRDLAAYIVILLLISGGLIGILAICNKNLSGQVYSFAVFGMFVFTFIICSFMSFIMVLLSPSALYRTRFLFVFILYGALNAVVIKVVLNAWSVTRLIQKRESLIANLKRWKEYNLENELCLSGQDEIIEQK